MISAVLYCSQTQGKFEDAGTQLSAELVQVAGEVPPLAIVTPDVPLLKNVPKEESTLIAACPALALEVIRR